MMHKLLVLGALPAAFAGVAPRGWAPEVSSTSEAAESSTTAAPHHWGSTTSTVYATSTYTVTSCAPEVTHCPAHATVVVTEVVPVSTTVCAVTDEPEPTSWEHDWGCSTSTSYSECVHTITTAVAPFVVTTAIPVTTITKKEVSTSFSECVHTVTNATKPYVATTWIPVTTVTYETTSTSYSDCVHTVTNASTTYPVTTWVPATTYTACPVKPTGGAWPAPPPAAGTGHYWPVPSDEASATWPAGGAKPTGSWATTSASKPIVTAGAAKDFGAAGALKMLGAAAAAAVLVL